MGRVLRPSIRFLALLWWFPLARRERSEQRAARRARATPAGVPM